MNKFASNSVIGKIVQIYDQMKPIIVKTKKDSLIQIKIKNIEKEKKDCTVYFDS
jgi:hypothetical protein